MLTACGSHAYWQQAQEYISALHTSLIEAGLCGSKEDCSSKELVFGSGDGPFLWYGAGVRLEVYGVTEPRLMAQLQRAVVDVHARLGAPSVWLTVYDSPKGSAPKIVSTLSVE
jgi:hypothetical protein